MYILFEIKIVQCAMTTIACYIFIMTIIDINLTNLVINVLILYKQSNIIY